MFRLPTFGHRSQFHSQKSHGLRRKACRMGPRIPDHLGGKAALCEGASVLQAAFGRIFVGEHGSVRTCIRERVERGNEGRTDFVRGHFEPHFDFAGWRAGGFVGRERKSLCFSLQPEIRHAKEGLGVRRTALELRADGPGQSVKWVSGILLYDRRGREFFLPKRLEFSAQPYGYNSLGSVKKVGPNWELEIKGADEPNRATVLLDSEFKLVNVTKNPDRGH
jgi:hypothetical protein